MDRVVADVIHPIACGLDVHSAVIAACLVRSGPQGGPHYEERSFATNLRGLRELRDWLETSGCQSVGLEATYPTPSPLQQRAFDLLGVTPNL